MFNELQARFMNALKLDNNSKYRMRVRTNDDYLFFSNEYATAQTGTSIIAAPGSGKRLVVKSIIIHSDATTGEVTINGTISASTKIINKLYATRFSNDNTGNENIALDENTAITLTTTTATSKVFIGINYIIESATN